MEAAKESALTHHSSTIVRSLSSLCNCVGMVFAPGRTWVNPDHLRMIFDDDGYRQVTEEADPTPGDVAVYRDDERTVTHVGLVVEVQTNIRDASRTIMVLSQWGRHSEYFHRVDDVSPYLGKHSEYWTDRI